MNSIIGIFGGSFDPVHTGHLAVAEAARHAAKLDTVLFLPCGQSPLKPTPPMTTPEQRVTMLQLATEHLPWAHVSEADLHTPQPSWSWRVAMEMHRQFPLSQLHWIMGADQWAILPQWNRWEYLASLVHFIVIERAGITTERHEYPNTTVRWVQADFPASSTAIRSALSLGQPVPDGFLPPAVAHFIQQNPQIYFSRFFA